MFYSQFILAKKGPLGTIWIAAHLERKLRKNQVADTDIGVSVDSILSPDVPIALRLSSHLLLGVVRIYSKKVSYLFDDCSDALLKVKQAFRSAAVDLPPEESTAPYHSITLPETFDLDDFELPDAADIFHGNYVDHHVSSREQITLQDTMEGVVFSASQFGLDERFGDGDTSGLDLDEIDNLGRVAETSGYAQAPCTPGLAEETNLFTTEEASLYDDHQDLEDPDLYENHVALACEDRQDSEDHNTTKLSTDTNNIDLCCGKQNGVVGSLTNDVNPAAGITSYTDDKSVEAVTPASEYPEGNLTSSDGVNGLRNEVIDNDDQQATCQVEPQTLKIDLLSLKSQDGLEISGHFSNSVPFIVESQSRSCPDNSEEVHISRDQISSFFSHEKVGVMDMHVLQPCKHLNQLSEAVPECYVTAAPHLQSGVSEMNSMEALGRNREAYPPGLSSEVQELTSLEVNGSDFCKMNDQVENVNSIEHQLEIFNGKDYSELPAPEKLLCVPPVGHEYDNPVHLLDSTPNREYLVIGDVDDARTNILSGKKRSFNESTLSIDSINLIESLGVVQSKRTKESVPDDDDLLSSILVGRRSSVFKLKSTPHLPPEMKTCKKRPRSTTRISSYKKVIVDETMVLHGDQIRQQLTLTEDIRRVRKKAPCTHAEIWMLRKEFLEGNIFTEPIFTGFSSDLASMYSPAYDLSDIKVSQNVTRSDFQGAVCSDIPVHADMEKETEKEVNKDSNLVKNDMEVQSPERQCLSENLPHQHFVEKSEMPINGEIDTNADAINFSAVNSVEWVFPPEPVSADKVDSPTASVDLYNGVQLDGSGRLHEQTLETQFVEMDVSVDASSRNVVDATIGEMDLQETVELDLNGTSTVAYDVGIEPAEASSHIEELDSKMKNSPVSHSEHPGIGSTNLQQEMDPQNVFVDYTATTDYGDLEYNIDAHDTGFLNEDDDDIIDEGEDCIPTTEHISAMDNSGWSSRTRAVAKYLQVLFDKEAEQGRKDLSMNNLLVGKTRKEASRMFFEALVLKTRDYIHVEQETPFGNINMKPRVKLMKADF